MRLPRSIRPALAAVVVLAASLVLALIASIAAPVASASVATGPVCESGSVWVPNMESCEIDACPDEALNPGYQPAGTTCVVAPAPAPVVDPAPAPAAAPAPAEEPWVDPAVDRDYTPELGNAAVPPDPVDAARETAIAPAPAPAAAAIASGASIPFTGLGLGALAMLGVALLLLGTLARAEARRLS